MKIFLLLPAAVCLALCCSCSTMEEGSSVAVPDRDKEGLSGPGVRMDDDNDIPKGDINQVDIHRRGRADNKEVGFDFFQYKHKF